MATTTHKSPEPMRVGGGSGRQPITARQLTFPPAAAWWRTYRHHLRLLRNGAIAWIVGLAGMGWGLAATFEQRHGSEEELAALRDTEGVPVFEALAGRFVEPATIEGFTLSRWGWFGILAAIWGMMAAVRLLRGAEETGHIEPLRGGGTITPRGLLGSALAALFTTHVLFAIAIAVGHTAGGLDAATSWATGGAIALLTASFAAGGALASQLFASRRLAVGAISLALGVTLGMRVVAAASATPEWVWWTTPFGWIGYLHEIDQARHWVFLAFGLLLPALVVAAFATARRDLHGAPFGGVEKRVRRAPPIGNDAGLAFRIVLPAARTWGLTIAALTGVMGLISTDFADMAVDLPSTVEVAEQMGIVGMDTPEGIVAWSVALFGALLLAVFVAGQVAAIREEEATWRLEHLLARPVGRTRWLLVRMAMVTVAVFAISLLAGLIAWLATAAVGASIGFGWGLLAGLNVVPVGVLVLGLGVALFGLLPRHAAPLTYGLVVLAFVLDFVGSLLELPEVVVQLSPFRHIASVPAADMNLGAALVMLAIGTLAAAIGTLVFRRRDLEEA